MTNALYEAFVEVLRATDEGDQARIDSAKNVLAAIVHAMGMRSNQAPEQFARKALHRAGLH